MIWCWRGRVRTPSKSKTWNSPVTAGTAYLLHKQNVSERLDTFSSFLYFARLFDAVGYQNTLTHIITSDLHKFEFPFASFFAGRQHLCIQPVSVDSQQCHQNGEDKDTANYLKY